MDERAIGEAPQSRGGLSELPSESVDVLGVVAVLAHLGRVADGGDALEGAVRGERHVHAEERVAVTRLMRSAVYRADAVQAHRHLDPHAVQAAVALLEPALQPAG